MPHLARRGCPLLALALAACAHPHPAPVETAFALQADAPQSAPAPYAIVHVDHVRQGGMRPFVKARAIWLESLTKRGTTDGRGALIQTGDSGFLSLSPTRSIGDLDRLDGAARAALSVVDPRDRAAYDEATAALLVPPHRSEVWRFDPSLSYAVTDPFATLSSAAWGKMTVEEIDPTLAGHAYADAWQQVREALASREYPLARVSFWSVYGTGDLVSFWLARSQSAFLKAPQPEVVVADALGADRAAELFAKMRAAVVASDAVDVIPRPDLSSRPF